MNPLKSILTIEKLSQRFDLNILGLTSKLTCSYPEGSTCLEILNSQRKTFTPCALLTLSYLATSKCSE